MQQAQAEAEAACVAYGGHLAVTELILDQGVEKNEKDKKGLTAYDWAMYLRKKTNRARDKTERERDAHRPKNSGRSVRSARPR